jgi:hypothetical protein
MLQPLPSTIQVEDEDEDDCNHESSDGKIYVTSDLTCHGCGNVVALERVTYEDMMLGGEDEDGGGEEEEKV